MKIIALEEHMFPQEVLDHYGLDLGPRVSKKIAELDDMAEGRLAMMDSAGVDVHVLSAMGWIVQDLDPVLSAEVSADINNRMACAIQVYPDRFRGFALLPISDPQRSVIELRRCVEELGFVGAMVHGQTHGVFLDAPTMRPLLAEVARLDVPLYIHPAPPPLSVHEAYFSGLPSDISTCLSTSGWGWHSECGLHVLRMVVSGVFDELPDLKVIVGHMGEGIPFHLGRIQDMLGPLLPMRERTISETLTSNVYLTTSGYVSDPPLQCALDTFGPEHVLFSVDYPMASTERAVEHLLSTPVLTADTRALIAHQNAASILRI